MENAEIDRRVSTGIYHLHIKNVPYAAVGGYGVTTGDSGSSLPNSRRVTIHPHGRVLYYSSLKLSRYAYTFHPSKLTPRKPTNEKGRTLTTVNFSKIK